MKTLENGVLSIIVAVDENGGFGYKGDIPWKTESFARDDFTRFKQITNDSVCIMGYRTYDEILKMKLERGGSTETPLLSNRTSYVITRRFDTLPLSPVAVFKSGIREAVEELSNEDPREIFVLGGEKMFIEALPWTSNIYLTVVKNIYQCDRFFPLEYVNRHFSIVEGQQTDDLVFLKLRRN